MDHNNKALPMPLRKDIRTYEPKKTEHLNRIQAATGVGPWTVRVDIADLAAYNKIQEDRGYGDRLGEIFWDSYMDSIATMLETACKDDMTKEGLLEQTSKHEIVLHSSESVPSDGYQRISFKDGALRIEFKPDRMWTNMNDITYFDMDKLL